MKPAVHTYIRAFRGAVRFSTGVVFPLHVDSGGDQITNGPPRDPGDRHVQHVFYKDGGAVLGLTAASLEHREANLLNTGRKTC